MITAEIKISINKQALQLVADLIIHFNGLAELIPEWNFIERDKFCKEINILLGEILDFERDKK